jgi:hypothetical protein
MTWITDILKTLTDWRRFRLMYHFIDKPPFTRNFKKQYIYSSDKVVLSWMRGKLSLQ